jgi:hypothetical protein
MRLWLFIGLCFIAGNAMADAYAFIGLNQMRVSVDGKGAQKEDWGATLGGGYRFTPHLAAEISYAYGHVAEGEARIIEWSSRNLGIAAVGTLAFRTRVSAIGRAGLQRMVGRWNHTLRSGSTSTRLEPEIGWTGWVPSLGLGAQYTIDKRHAIRAMAELTGGVDGLKDSRSLSVTAVIFF